MKAYPAGAPCWVEALAPDPRAAAEFYGSLLGWEFGDPGPMPGGGAYYVTSIDGQDAAGIAQLPPGAHPQWTTYIRVADVEASSKRAVEAGGTLVVPPLDAPPAGRLSIIDDPSGASFGLWQAQEREGVQHLEGVGAWAMSGLRTFDLDRAARFYGALFGWTTTEASNPRTTRTTLFHLPGYTSRRSQQLPPDVVAYVMEISPPEHAAWSAAFWADDVDAAARFVAERGGRILVGPVNAGGIQRLVIADPFGAICTLTQRA